MNQKQKVLITRRVPHEWLSVLDDIAEVTIWDGKNASLMPREVLMDLIGNYNAVINFTDIKTDEEFINQARQLKIIANVSIGHDNLNLPLLTENGIWATNTPGFFTYPTAEYAFVGMMIILRKMLEADSFVRNGDWHGFEPGRWDGVSLHECSVGIIGLGSIGSQLKKLVKAIGADVVYYTRKKSNEEDYRPLDELLRSSDIISLHVPLNSSTKKMVDGNFISKMKDGAILVNTSRGGILDLNDCIAALKTGKLGGAVLDVFEDEPHVPAPLRAMKNVLLTPHMAGGTHTVRELSVSAAARNVADALSGKKPQHALNSI